MDCGFGRCSLRAYWSAGCSLRYKPSICSKLIKKKNLRTVGKLFHTNHFNTCANIPHICIVSKKIYSFKIILLFYQTISSSITLHLPKEWRFTTVIPLYKNKDDIQDCNNYRGLNLLNHTMKLCIMVNERTL